MKKENKKTTDSAVSNDTPWMITLPQAAKLTGLSLDHIRKLVKSDALPYYRAGDRYYVWVEDLRTVLRNFKEKK